MNWVKRVYQQISEKSRIFWLSLAFFLVSILSFEAGMLERALKEGEPVIIRVPDQIPPLTVPNQVSAKIVPQSAETPETSIPDQSEHCAFVGSKKSNKYHAPTSRCAKQIKPENQICFDSVEQAQSKGYLPGCLE